MLGIMKGSRPSATLGAEKTGFNSSDRIMRQRIR